MHISIAANPVLSLGPVHITNSMLATLSVLIILWLTSLFATRKMELVPTGLQNVTELGIEKLIGLTNSVIHDKKYAEKVFPLIATFFIFILFNNWFGLVPGVGSIGFNEVIEGKEVMIPLLRAGTADLNTTIALGIIVVVMTQVFGIAAIGVFRYGKKFINFSNPINFFVGLIELASELVRIISFSFRLFGNVFAGEVLLIVLGSIAPYIIPLPFYFMELFVGFIQALVFTMLALVFFSMATMTHDAH
ncbi:MAG: F0F1 ATP synthase subunit A [bacterium]